MRHEPQAYSPDPQITALAPWLGDEVAPADFPQTIVRWRNPRAAASVGLDGLDEAQWIAHFARFAPLPDNLPRPLALRYHGHQFRHYNPDIGDGRGFLFAQLRDGAGRLLDLGTKGSGTTPWSRQGDGRLTLKGGFREILATEMLEALGANTSKTFSLIETGERLYRGDEPSPTRSAVLTRLSHGHIRFGTFQRLLMLDEPEHMAALVEYALTQFPGPQDDNDHPAIRLLNQVVERMADLAASYVTAGFVHGVLNTDNMNISGESFDYGPWRWLPRWDAGFTAAYFDHAGLYAFGRQAEAIRWNCGQLAVALRLLVPDTAPLIAALDRFDPLYQSALSARVLWRLGLEPLGDARDAQLLAAAGSHMAERQISPDAFFHTHRGGRNAEDFPAMADHTPMPHALAHEIWQKTPPNNHIETVETLWSTIAEHDDWQPFFAHIAHIQELGQALGTAPIPKGHLRR
jgi:uncharacterized protein YdiU (UPF0061 family)